MILSNLTTPLMGLVDTAVLGHLDSAHYLAGASVAGLFITQLYWLCGFLRMTSTGLSAQALGEGNSEKAAQCLAQGLLLSVLLGAFILLTQSLWLDAVLFLANAQLNVAQVIKDYFETRIWGAPAALANLALVGWLIGQQKAKQVLWIQIIGNLLNAVLSIALVVGFKLDVSGVALATVIAEYTISGLSLWAVWRMLPSCKIDLDWFSLDQMKGLLGLNGYSFVRNITLQLCLAFLVFQGMRFGQTSAAVNAILLQFFSLIALGLDGIAFSAEALVGEQKGKKNPLGVAAVVLQSLLWSLGLAIIYSAVFWFFGDEIVTLLTSHQTLQDATTHYLPIIALLPLLAHWCFLLDGVFVGLTRAKAMQNSMLASALLAYLPLWWLFSDLGNQGLWFALLAFLFARGLSLGGYFIYLYRTAQVV
ncbi:MATE family efflux transporter [Paraglaciecola sp.]|uniref:MATE family efflux transporter n=1 Tax=Paraglaciecola sp. TaxID=1920173 RepID=UPI0030F3CCA7